MGASYEDFTDDENEIDPITQFKTRWTPLCHDAFNLLDRVADAYASIRGLYKEQAVGKTKQKQYVRTHKKGEEINLPEFFCTISGVYEPTHALSKEFKHANNLGYATSTIQINLLVAPCLRTRADNSDLYQQSTKANAEKNALDAIANEKAICFFEKLLLNKMGLEEFDFAKMSSFVGKLNGSKNDHHYNRLLAFALYELYSTYEKQLNVRFSDHFVDEKSAHDKTDRQNMYDLISLIVVPDDYLERYGRFRDVFSKVTNIELVALQTDTAADAKGGAGGPAALPEKCQELIDHLNELGEVHYGIKHPDEKNFVGHLEPKFNALVLKVRNQMQAEIKRGTNEAKAYESGLRVVAATLKDKLPRREWFSSVKISGSEAVEYLNAKLNERHFPRLLATFLHGVDSKHFPAYKNIAPPNFPKYVTQYLQRQLAPQAKPKMKP